MRFLRSSMVKFNGGVYFICFRLAQQPFLGKVCPKSQNCHFKLKIGNKTNSNIKNSMVIFTFLFSTRSIHFWKFAPKIKIVC